MERYREGLRRLVDHRLFGGGVFVLILVSVGLLAWELALPEGSATHRVLVEVQGGITVVFVLELLLRWLANGSTRCFLRDYWIDILAVLPLLRVFRLWRAFRLLRLLRLLRLPNLMDRHLRVLGFLFRRRGAEYLLYLFLVGFAVVAGTLALATFEPRAPGLGGLEWSFWSALFSLFSGEYVTEHPGTLGGKLAVLMIMFSGLGFFAVLTGTISAIMIEKLKEGAVLRRMSLDELSGHILVCGWNSGVETMLKEIQETPRFRDKDVVVICSREELPELSFLADPSRVRHLREDFTRAEVLVRAMVSTAEVAVLVSDLSEGRTRQDADARTVLAALTIEKLNPRVYTCAELSNAMNEPHLRMGKVDQVIITRELAGRMLAQAAMHSGAIVVLKDLLRSSTGCHLVNLAVEGDLVGLDFADCLGIVRKKHGLVPLAAQRAGGEVGINPDGWRLEKGDTLICVSGAGRVGA